MGTSKSDTCNQIGKKIWLFCQAEDIWVTCAHVPGVENEIADFDDVVMTAYYLPIKCKQSASGIAAEH